MKNRAVIFTYGDITVKCYCRRWTENGIHYGFKHVADLYIDGVKAKTCSVKYYNRTWERYQYESALRRVATSALEDYTLEGGTIHNQLCGFLQAVSNGIFTNKTLPL